jgi:hypothetical protein
MRLSHNAYISATIASIWCFSTVLEEAQPRCLYFSFSRKQLILVSLKLGLRRRLSNSVSLVSKKGAITAAALPKKPIPTPTTVPQISVAVFACCGNVVLLGLARTVYMHRIWPYIWWSPCQNHRIYTVYIWFWPTLCTCVLWKCGVTNIPLLHHIFPTFWPTLCICVLWKCGVTNISLLQHVISTQHSSIQFRNFAFCCSYSAHKCALYTLVVYCMPHAL